MQARFVRAIITGAVFAIPVSLYIWVTSIMIDRAAAPLFARGLDAYESMCCEICLLQYVGLAIIFALTGVATVTWCGRLISGANDAIKAAVVAAQERGEPHLFLRAHAHARFLRWPGNILYVHTYNIIIRK